MSFPSMSFLRSTPLGIAALALLAGVTSASSSITPGNIVVVRLGDGLSPLTNSSTAAFLDEYTSAGALVQSIPLPIAAAGSNNPLTNSATATSEGFLGLSTDGQYLLQVGYGVAPGMAGIATTLSTVAPRVIARTEIATGTIDTSTLLSGDTSYSGGNIRSAASDNGTEFWTAGTAPGGADAGVRYIASLGANTSVQLSTDVTNTRVVGIFNGQLYVSSASGSYKGLNSLGTGLPTTPGQTTVLLPGFPSASPSQYDFFWADPNTFYFADDGSVSGGIQKWTVSSGVWSMQYVLSPATGVGCRGISGLVNAGVVTLYATTTQSVGNEIVTVTDTGAGSPFTTIATSTTNEIFRGVRLIPGNPGTSVVAICDPGVSGVISCPCSNPPSGSGRGCDNSASTGGALITAAGSASLAVDTLVFTTAAEKPTATSVVLQGDNSNSTGVAFGQGVRCASGVLKRLYVKSASGGAISAPQAGDPSVSTRSALLGDVIVAAQHRYYMVYYRDPIVLGGCSAVLTFNGTNTLDVTWAP